MKSAVQKNHDTTTAPWCFAGSPGDELPGGEPYLGDAPRTVEYWVRRFEEKGLTGLVEGERPGRPRRLNDKQIEEINAVLRQPPESAGITRAYGMAKPCAPLLKSGME